MISKISFGREPCETHQHREDEQQRTPRNREPEMAVTWPKRDILVFDLSVYNSGQEPVAVDIRVYAAYFDGCQDPPHIETQIGIAAILGTRVFFGRQVIPDSSMCAGGVWTSGANALKLPKGTEHVLLMAKIDKPRARDDLPCADIRCSPHLALWSSDASKLKELGYALQTQP